jgi:ligand-binding sensor domain-containing protein/signal transduction histidine kinase
MGIIRFCRLASVLLMFLCGETVAQRDVEKVRFSRIEVSAGLSNSNVTCIVQDLKGFLWVGTADGLNRFDGYNFKVYRNSQDSNSLLRNSISCVFEDSEKRFWVSTRGGGLHYYDYGLDKFIRIPEFSSDCQILQIMEDERKELWITGTRYYDAFVGHLNRKTGKWESFRLFPSKEPITSIVRLSDKEFLIGLMRGGLRRWDSSTNSCVSYPALENNSGGSEIRKIIKDSRGKIWVGANSGLFVFDPHATSLAGEYGGAFHQGAHITFPVRDIYPDNDLLWVATLNGGLYKINTVNGRIDNFVFEKDDPFSISDNSVWSVYKDGQKRIWVGTFSKGLCVIDKLQNKFAQLDVALESDIVNAIYEDSKGRIWIGTEKGITRKDGNTVRYYHHDPNEKGSLSSDPVLSISEDSRHRIWIGTWAGGLNLYHDETDSFTSFQHDDKKSESLSNQNVYAIMEEAKTHQLFVSSYAGLNILTDEKNGTFDHYMGPRSESNSYLRCLFQDNTGTTWIGTVEELNVFDGAEGKILRFDETNITNPKKSEIVNCIIQDKKGRVWVGATEGLLRIENKKAVKRYTVKDGLPNNIVNGILEDRSGNLWLSTTKGLSKFNPEEVTIQNYTTSDGLSGDEFKPNACFKNKDGLFFFGGKGVTVFDPDNIQRNPYPPPVYITDFKIFNKSVAIGEKDSLLRKQITETKEISLSYSENFFSFEFAALNFSSSDKNQYAYKLEGFDHDWVNIGGQRTATFTNLNPDDYTFRVKASNNDGVWNETGATLVIHVLPPFWKTWWFTTLTVSMIVMASVAYYRNRIGAITRRNKKLEDEVAKRTNDLVLRDEEILAQNNDLLMQREALADQNKELQAARQIIEEQNNEIRERNESLESEIKERTKDLVDYNQQLEQFAFISAHNLRGPVARILGLGNILEYARNNPEEVKMILDKLICSTQELDDVVKDLNTILELRKNYSAHISTVLLKDELAFIKTTLERNIVETSATITEDFSSAPEVRTIKPYLDSILINLIGNAIKFRHPWRFPEIQVTSRVVDDYICLSVSDNGLGLNLDLYQEKLFTLYARFHHHVEGKGIGLYLVKTQVAALGGKIEVESRQDIGTTFKVYLKNR